MLEPKTKFCQERARSAADAARLARGMGNLQFAEALHEIETIWLRLARQMETLEQRALFSPVTLDRDTAAPSGSPPRDSQGNRRRGRY
jgi:hypothetical protein